MRVQKVYLVENSNNIVWAFKKKKNARAFADKRYEASKLSANGPNSYTIIELEYMDEKFEEQERKEKAATKEVFGTAQSDLTIIK